MSLKDMQEEMGSAISRGEGVANCVLVETRGSTPQKAGARMLVYADGGQWGTLGGGCVEAEVKRKALELLRTGKTELLSFQLNHDYGWDDGLICGGRMTMLVEGVRPGTDVEYYRTLGEWTAQGRGLTEAVMLEEQGGIPGGSRFVFDGEGEFVMSRPGGLTPPAEMALGLKSLKGRPRPYVSGGNSYLPQLNRCRLLIVGAGHVGQKVAELAAQVDFDVWVVDDRSDYASEERFPAAKRRIVGPIDEVLPHLEVDSDMMCIIVTRGHNHDEEALYHMAKTNARYVGMIGSKRKIRMILEDLQREGISEEALSRVYAPLGFEIGSQTVPEIAVSIVAELIAHRNTGGLSRQTNAVYGGAAGEPVSVAREEGSGNGCCGE